MIYLILPFFSRPTLSPELQYQKADLHRWDKNFLQSRLCVTLCITQYCINPNTLTVLFVVRMIPKPRHLKMSLLIPVLLIVINHFITPAVTLLPGYTEFELPKRAHSLFSLLIDKHYSFKFTYVKPDNKSMILEANPPTESVPAKILTATIMSSEIKPLVMKPIEMISKKPMKASRSREACAKFMDIADEFGEKLDTSEDLDTVAGSWSAISKDLAKLRQKFENVLNARLTVDEHDGIKVGEYPHVAALGSTNENGDFINRCTGSIIDSNWILTAAHCTLPAPGNLTTVRLGVTNIQPNSTNGQSYGVKRIVRHPMYKSSELYNDIALLELDRSINFSSTMRPACLAASSGFPNGDVWITGWATSELDGRREDILQEARLTRFTMSWCLSETNLASKIPKGFSPSMICGSAAESRWRHDTCRSDSDGLLHTKLPDHDLFTVIGVASFDSDCKKLWSPKVFTDVTIFTQWIENIVWPDSN